MMMGSCVFEFRQSNYECFTTELHMEDRRSRFIRFLSIGLSSFFFGQVFIFSLSEVEEGKGVYDCWASFDPPWTLILYVTWNNVSIFIVPSIILAVLYGHISHTVWKCSSMEENLVPRYISQLQPADTEGRGQPSSHTACAWDSKQPIHSHPQNIHPSASPDKDSQFPRNIGDLSKNDINHKTTSSLSGTRDWEGKYHSSTPSSKTSTGGALLESTQDPNPNFLNLTHPHNGNANRGSSFQDRNPGSLTSPDTGSSSSVSNSGPCHNGNSDGPKPFQSSSAFSEAASSPCLIGNSSSTCPGRAKGRGGGGGAGGGRGRGGMGGRGSGGGGVDGISRAKMKTIKLTLTVVICYMVCWTPFYVAQLWAAYDENVPYDNIFFTLVLLLASVNSCTNPWIYMAFSDTIWNSLRARLRALTLCFRFRRNQDRNRSARNMSERSHSSFRSMAVTADSIV